MSETTVDDLLRRQGQMESHRSNFETHWKEIEDRMTFMGRQFRNSSANDFPGTQGNERQFDITAPLACQKFAAAVDSLATPSTSRYHAVTPLEIDLLNDATTLEWCEEATNLLFFERYRPRAAFQSNMYQTWYAMGMYGNGPMFVDEIPGDGAIYRASHLSQVYFSEDESGRVDRVHRKARVTLRQVRQLCERLGATFPKQWEGRLKQNAEQRTELLLCIGPRADLDPERWDAKGMRFEAYWVLTECREILHEGGYHSFPWAIARYSLEASGEVYGRGPASIALPEIKMLNEMRKTQIRAAQRTVDPPVLLPEDAMLKPFNMRSNAMNRGYVNENGQALAQPFNFGARIDLGQEAILDSRNTVNDAFLVNLFRILVEKPSITATEAMLLAQEKGQLLSPTLGRAHSDVLGVVVARELDIHYRAGRLPPMPAALQRAGGMLRIEYMAPLNRLQRAEDAVGFLRTIETVGPMAQVDPSVTLIFDMKKAARDIAYINGAPLKWTRTPDEVDELEKAQQLQIQQQQLLAAAPVAASAAKDAAQAHATAMSAPQQLVPA